MRFIVNDIELNLTAGSIIQQGEITHIRAKTLQVLNYLITNQSKIVTKQELLTSIWHDVVVQEQVLVQSIKEIRTLLGSDVIKTYPRQGYQWVAEIDAIEKSAKPVKNLFHPLDVFSGTCLLIAFVFILYLVTQVTQNDESAKNFTVGFLPIENDMPDDIHNWVPLEGKQYLTETLQQYEGLSVVTISSPLSTLELYTKPEEVSKLQENQSIDLIVQSRLLGYPQDFQLHYNFHLKHNTERGIVFAKSVKQCFEQLVRVISKRYGNNIEIGDEQLSLFKRDFSNEAFARGIELYLNRDFKGAMPFFKSSLQVNPELLVARRYLAASAVNSGELLRGINLMLSNIEQAKELGNQREQIRSYLMAGVLLINWPSAEANQNINLIRAKQYIESANTIALAVNDILFTAYSYEELGKIARLQGQYIQATSLLQQALSFHEKLPGNYSQTNALIELARVSAAQGSHLKTQQYFRQAQLIAEDNGVATNKVSILLAQAGVAQQQSLSKKANQYAEQALKIANEVRNPYLVNRVNAWINNHPHYEIN